MYTRENDQANIREWDVEEKKSSNTRERTPWVVIPLVLCIFTVISCLLILYGLAYFIKSEEGQTRFVEEHAAVCFLITLSVLSLSIFGFTEIKEVLKETYGWGKQLKAHGGVGQNRGRRGRGVFMWAFTFLAPIPLMLYLARFSQPPSWTQPWLPVNGFSRYLVLCCLCLWGMFFLKIFELYTDTWWYRLFHARKLTKRRQQIQAFAHENSYSYRRRRGDTFPVEWVKYPNRSLAIPHFKADWEHQTWNPVDDPVFDAWRGKLGYAENIVRWRANGRQCHVFDYHDMIDYGFTVFPWYSFLLEQNPTDFSVISIKEDYKLPALLVFTEALWDKVGKRIGHIDIDLDSIEFSERYRIWSKNRKFAYDVCHGLAMEYLMAHPDMAVHIEGRVRSFRFHGLVPVEEIPARVEEAIAFCDLLPRYLRDDAKAAMTKVHP